MRRTLHRLGLFLFLTAASFTGSSSWESHSVIAAPQQGEISKSDLPRNKSGYKMRTISRKVKLERAAAGASPFVTLRLNDLEPTDHVNIRPTEKSEIEVTAGLMLPKPEKADDAATVEKRLPESSLEVTTDAIAFTRPRMAGVVVLDVALPSGTQTSAIFDGEVILNAAAALQEPISIKGREVRRGAQDTATAVLQSVLPPAMRGQSAPTTATKLPYSGRYFVPFPLLQVRKRVAVDPGSPRIRAGVDIDKEGKVIKVTPYNEDSAFLEKALMQWEFAPYIVDGQPVAVMTVISLGTIVK